MVSWLNCLILMLIFQLSKDQFKLAEYKQQLSAHFESCIKQLWLKDDSQSLKFPIDNVWSKKSITRTTLQENM